MASHIRLRYHPGKLLSPETGFYIRTISFAYRHNLSHGGNALKLFSCRILIQALIWTSLAYCRWQIFTWFGDNRIWFLVCDAFITVIMRRTSRWSERATNSGVSRNQIGLDQPKMIGNKLNTSKTHDSSNLGDYTSETESEGKRRSEKLHRAWNWIESRRSMHLLTTFKRSHERAH